MAFYVPIFTIYIHSNTGRIIEAKNLYHKEQEIIKFRNLEIWKLFDIKNTYYKGYEIIKFENESLNYNIDEVRRQKDWKIKKLAQGNRNRCNAKKLKKLIVLNYTERGKRQKIYNYFYTISILYTVITYNIFLYITQFFYILLIGYILGIYFPYNIQNLTLHTLSLNFIYLPTY